MLLQVVVSCVFLCSITARAAPQIYGVVEVREPLPNTVEVGPFEKIVGSVVDLLPEITGVFQKITKAREPSGNPVDFKSIEEIIVSFVSIMEKMQRASAEAEGREVKPEELERFSRVTKVLPGYLRLLEEITKRDFSDPAAAGTDLTAAAAAAPSPSASLPDQQAPAVGTLTPVAPNFSHGIIEKPGTTFYAYSQQFGR